MTEPKPGFVYFIGCGEPVLHVKIGCTTSLATRLSHLQIGNPHPLTLLGWIESPNAAADERVLHARFERFRTSGEWFMFHASIKSFLLSGEVQLSDSCGDAIDGVAFPEVFHGMAHEDAAPPPSDRVIMDDLAERTLEALSLLTPREEKVLRMRFGIQQLPGKGK